MEGISSSSGVTAKGVRSGDPAALQALVDRRGPAVIAFCGQVCGPANAARASAEAFARFRAAVRDAPDPGAVDPETLLLGATRHAAASMARVPSGPPPHGKLRSRGTETCQHVPTMLAARAAGALGEADLERLARHLERCERCAALEEIFRRAEMAYADPSIDELTPETSALMLAALQAVSAEPPAGLAPPPRALPAELARTPQAEAAPLPVVAEVPAMAAALGEPAETRAEDVELPVEDVEPAAIAPQALAAEPLPEAAPPVDEHGDDLGATMEWDNELPHVHDDADDHDLAPAGGAAVLEGGRERRGGLASRLAVLVPVVLVGAAIAAVLALAGVFDSGDATAPETRPAAVRPVNYRPVLTPLPVKVAKPAAPSTKDSAAAPSAGGTATTTTPGSAAEAPSSAATPQGAAPAPSTAAPSDQTAAAPQDATTTPGGTAAPDEAPSP